MFIKSSVTILLSIGVSIYFNASLAMVRSVKTAEQKDKELKDFKISHGGLDKSVEAISLKLGLGSAKDIEGLMSVLCEIDEYEHLVYLREMLEEREKLRAQEEKDKEGRKEAEDEKKCVGEYSLLLERYNVYNCYLNGSDDYSEKLKRIAKKEEEKRRRPWNSVIENLKQVTDKLEKEYNIIIEGETVIFRDSGTCERLSLWRPKIWK